MKKINFKKIILNISIGGGLIVASNIILFSLSSIA